MPWYKFTGTQNKHEDWTEEIILEKDDDGNPTNVLKKGKVSELNEEQAKNLSKELGIKLDKVDGEVSDEDKAVITEATAPTDSQSAGPDLGHVTQGGQAEKAADQQQAQQAAKKKS